MRLSPFSAIIIGLLLGSLLNGGRAHAASEKELWSEIRQAWGELDHTRKAVVAELKFTIPKKQLKASSRFKFLVEDQLRKIWLFKSELTQVAGSTAIDGVSTVVGIPSVPYFEYQLELNGHPLSGSVQLFIQNEGDFAKISMPDLSPLAALDVAKHHALGWLMMNHHVHAGQFLVGDSRAAGGSLLSGPVYRIDNSVEWYLMGHDRLTIDYSSPVLWHAGGVGYANFFRSYVRKEIDIDRAALFSVIDLLRTMPDDLFLSFFSSLKKDGFRDFGGISLSLFSKRVLEHKAPTSVESFEKYLLARKRSLRSDFVRFYRELAVLRGEKWVEPKVDIRGALSQQLEHLRRETEKWRSWKQGMASAPNQGGGTALSMAASERAYRAVRISLTEMYNMPKTERTNRLAVALERVKELEKTETEPNELAGIRDLKKVFEGFIKSHERDEAHDLLDTWRFHMRLNEARR